MQMLRSIKNLIRDFQQFRMLKDNLELPPDMDLGRHIALQAQEIRTLKLRLDPNTKWGKDYVGWEQIEPGLYIHRD